MALKNYTTKVSAGRSIQEIQEMLQKVGATGILTEYEKDTGKISGMSFQISFNETTKKFNNKIKVEKKGLG